MRSFAGEQLLRFVRFMPTTGQLLSVDYDGVIRIVSFAGSVSANARKSGKVLRRGASVWGPEAGRILSLDLSPDCRAVAFIRKDGRLIQTDLSSTEKMRRNTLKWNKPVWDMAFLPRSGLLLTASLAGISICDPTDGSVLLTLPAGPQQWTRLSVSADGRQVAATNHLGDVFVWDVDDTDSLRCVSGPRKIISGHGPRIGCLVFSPSESLVAVTHQSSEGVLRLVDTKTGRHVSRIPATNCQACAFSADGELLFFAADTDDGMGSQRVIVWERSTSQVVRRLQTQDRLIQAIVCGQSDRLVASAGHDMAIRLWDQHKDWRSRDLAGPEHFSCLAFTPDGKSLATSGKGDVVLWHIETSQYLYPAFHLRRPITKILFSQDGRKLACLAKNGDLIVIDTNFRDAVRRQVTLSGQG